MCVRRIRVRPVFREEEARYRELMRKHHYLGFVPKMGQTLWYVATIDNPWASRSMDWMELSASVWAIEAGGQQQPVFNFAGLAYTQFGIQSSFIVFKAISR